MASSKNQKHTSSMKQFTSALEPKKQGS